MQKSFMMNLLFDNFLYADKNLVSVVKLVFKPSCETKLVTDSESQCSLYSQTRRHDKGNDISLKMNAGSFHKTVPLFLFFPL